MVKFVKREKLCILTEFGIMLSSNFQDQDNQRFDSRKNACSVRQTTAKSTESLALAKSSDKFSAQRGGAGKGLRRGTGRDPIL